MVEHLFKRIQKEGSKTLCLGFMILIYTAFSEDRDDLGTNCLLDQESNRFYILIV